PMPYIKLHPLYLPEILTEIFSYLAEDKTLYLTLFVNWLWHLYSAPILWKKAEFSGNLNNTCTRWRKFKQVMCGKYAERGTKFYKPHAPFLL
ncbi:11245_t:CDS:1, partial [Dentiscutata erythropus]